MRDWLVLQMALQMDIQMDQQKACWTAQKMECPWVLPTGSSRDNKRGQQKALRLAQR
jgi:hypothetical protein